MNSDKKERKLFLKQREKDIKEILEYLNDKSTEFVIRNRDKVSPKKLIDVTECYLGDYFLDLQEQLENELCEIDCELEVISYYENQTSKENPMWS